MSREPSATGLFSRGGGGRRSIGCDPSRVIHDHNPNAHAGRIALGSLQRRPGIVATIGAVIYAIIPALHPRRGCLAVANVQCMYFAADDADAGRWRWSQ